ncbi:MAG: 4Fe-4S binding protein [Adlercreutzia equolifaciens]
MPRLLRRLQLRRYRAEGRGRANPIPYVVEDKCNGCGACQAACLSLSSGSIKSSERAIVVRPVEA